MSNMSNNTMTLADFERLLDVYGSERARWPVEARASAGQLVARDGAARRLLAEAEALDRALDRAPVPSLMQEAALADRILAAARRSPRVVATNKEAAGPSLRPAGNVVPLPATSVRAPWLKRTVIGGAAGALAASLALGVFLGLAGLPQGVLPVVEDVTGISLGNSGRVVAQIDFLDEDLL